jgi:hypothetical protein
MLIKPWYKSVLILFTLMFLFMISSCKIQFREFTLVAGKAKPITVDYCSIEAGVVTYVIKGVEFKQLASPMVRCISKGVE